MRAVASSATLFGLLRPYRSRTPRLFRCVLLAMTALFVWVSLLAAPAQVLAQALSRTQPIPARFKDDPAWRDIDYTAPRPAVPAAVRAVPPPLPTLLNGAGQLERLVSTGEAEGWRSELHAGARSAARKALLNLWLGEYRLAHDQPAQAAWYFRTAGQIARRSDSVFGLAAYDLALARFYAGAYREASDRFYHLLTARQTLPGLDRRDLALWYGHAKACAGYHAERAVLGIPEPPQLDPLCGAAALAECLKAQGRPYGKATTLAATHVTGRGSSLRDLLNAARKLGLRARAFGADEPGLIALPKPLVAFVEHDHFICVVKADAQGVSYLCSDCGPWPGGRVALSWKQWRKLEASVYAAVYPAGSDLEAVLDALAARKAAHAAGQQTAGAAERSLRAALVTDWGQESPGVRPAVAAGFPQGVGEAASAGVRLAGFGQAGLLARQARLVERLASHLILDPPETQQCGTSPIAKPCANFWCCPYDYCIPCNHNAAQGDPVNVANGQEEYAPEPDLVVYNPVGPAVVWSREYDSLRGSIDDTFNDADFGNGWTHPYNVGVIDTAVKQNWAIPQGGSGSIPANTGGTPPNGYPNFPPSGVLWNIYY